MNESLPKQIFRLLANTIQVMPFDKKCYFRGKTSSCILIKDYKKCIQHYYFKLTSRLFISHEGC